MTALGMVLMVIGGLCALSAVRNYALYAASRRRAAAVSIEAWLRFVFGMLAVGAVLAGVGYLLAF